MKKTNKILLLVSLLSFGCQNYIPMTIDRDFENKIHKENDKLLLYFEQLFQDSIKINYNKKEIFKKFLVTNKRLSVSPDVCVIDTIYKDKYIHIILNNKNYYFKPKSEYRYYYFNKLDNNFGVVYSNVKREYN